MLVDTPLHPRRLESASAPQCKPYILQDCGLLGCCSFADRYHHLGGSMLLHNAGTLLLLLLLLLLHKQMQYICWDVGRKVDPKCME